MADRKRSGIPEPEAGEGSKRRNFTVPEAIIKEPQGSWEVPANDCIAFHLVRRAQDLDGSTREGGLVYTPEYTHQHFGDGETIYGYKGLRVDVYFHAVTFHAYVTIQYQECKKGGGQKAVDVLKLLKEHMPGGIIESRESYLGLLSQAESIDISRFGLPLKSYSAPQGDAPAAECQIVRCGVEDERVRDWFQRLQAVTLFHIDGASLITLDDPSWEIFVALERGHSEGGQPTMHVAGFCTVYHFYAYPDSTRMRLSQLLVLPPFRRRGHAWHLLEQVFAEAAKRGCYDVTVEDPNQDFQRLRDVHDMRRLAGDAVFQEAVAAARDALLAAEGVAQGRGKASGPLVIPPSLVKRLRETFQITKNQAKRCFEMALYQAARGDPAQGLAFQSRVLARLRLAYETDAVESSAAGKVLEETDTGFIMLPRAALGRACGATGTLASRPGNLASNEAAGSGHQGANGAGGGDAADNEGSDGDDDGAPPCSMPDTPMELTSEEKAKRSQEDYDALQASYDLVLQRVQ